MSGIVTLGESLGLIVGTRTGGFDLQSAAEVSFGGAETNVAIGVARLGGRAGWIGRLGDDAMGRRITRALRAEGVEAHVRLASDAPTAIMLKDRPRPDASRVTYYRTGSAASRMEPADLPVAVIREAALLHVSGINLAISHSSARTTLAAVELARDAGVPVSFDVNHRSRLWAGEQGRDSASAAYRALVALADIVFAGDDEAALVTDEDGHDAQAAALAALGPSQVVIKLGADGAFALHAGHRFDQTALRVTVVDTVGAGDAFVAGYLSEFVAGSSIEERLRIGAAAGAFACGMPGDWEGAATRADIEAMAIERDPVER
ncbi:sugar kinase [Agrococcus sp. ARC_14]|uniref:sugar kinase n=1 Tax=Agrococcus sp. ARC_14 TaxID=2919927 RepID=UPI001F05BA2A|nr:sugar kinase [Agrococcus sp. ARC_14]MCH1882007.1 sugar kinase [Agrococcus sp. ARC_14]